MEKAVSKWDERRSQAGGQQTDLGAASPDGGRKTASTADVLKQQQQQQQRTHILMHLKMLTGDPIVLSDDL